MRHLVIAATAVGLLGSTIGLAACGERKKVNECNALIDIINTGVEEIQRGTRPAPDAGPGAKELRELAESMDGVATQASKVQLSLPELKKFSEQYEGMTRDVATAARELAVAFEKVDEESMRKAQAKMEDAVQREEPLVAAINKYCRAP